VFKLVNHRLNIGEGKNVDQTLHIVVGDSNGSSPLSVDSLFQFSPSDVVRLLFLVVWVLAECANWPVHEVEINVSSLQVLQGLLQNVNCIDVGEREELSGDEDVFSLVLAFSEDFGESLANHLVVLIENGGVDVSVAVV